MNDLEQLLADIEADNQCHVRDVRLLKVLLMHAEHCNGRADSGAEWLAAMGGNLAAAKSSLAFMQKELNGMLVEWFVNAALAAKEKEQA